MRFSIAWMMELTLALAFGFFVARTYSVPKGFDQTIAWTMIYRIGPALHGVALVEGIGLWLERARRRGPSTWGFGRWTWSIMAALILLHILEAEARLAVGYVRMLSMGAPSSAAWQSTHWWGDVIYAISRVTSYQNHWVPLALWITACTARLPSDNQADAREWSGRVLAVCLVVWWVACRILEIWLSW